MKHYETKGERLVQDRGMYAHHMVQCCNCSAITTLHGHLHGLVWGFGILRFSFSFCVWLEPLFAPPSLSLSHTIPSRTRLGHKVCAEPAPSCSRPRNCMQGGGGHRPEEAYSFFREMSMKGRGTSKTITSKYCMTFSYGGTAPVTK